MSWPKSTDYIEAVQNLRSSLCDEELREGRAAINAMGLPMLWSGHFADVYKIECPATGNVWALKCFTREVAGLRERYRDIAAHLDQARLPFTVKFHYLDRGIRVGGEWFPALKMQWVEGLSLNQFVEHHVDRPRTLGQLLGLWPKLARRLREARMAHADLQHGNVILVPMRRAACITADRLRRDVCACSGGSTIGRAGPSGLPASAAVARGDVSARRSIGFHTWRSFARSVVSRSGGGNCGGDSTTATTCCFGRSIFAGRASRNCSTRFGNCRIRKPAHWWAAWRWLAKSRSIRFRCWRRFWSRASERRCRWIRGKRRWSRRCWSRNRSPSRRPSRKRRAFLLCRRLRSQSPANPVGVSRCRWLPGNPLEMPMEFIRLNRRSWTQTPPAAGSE